MAILKRSNARLEIFNSNHLDHVGDLGEGVSYKVTLQTRKDTEKAYAVKEVKLPADSTSFQRQIACVMRDVQVSIQIALPYTCATNAIASTDHVTAHCS